MLMTRRSDAGDPTRKAVLPRLTGTEGVLATDSATEVAAEPGLKTRREGSAVTDCVRTWGRHGRPGKGPNCSRLAATSTRRVGGARARVVDQCDKGSAGWRCCLCSAYGPRTGSPSRSPEQFPPITTPCLAWFRSGYVRRSRRRPGHGAGAASTMR
jgi:hypothetical protein